MKRHARLAKLDESTDYRRLRPVLQNAGFEVLTVDSQGLKGAADAEVIRAAANEWAILVTQDPDMADLRKASTQRGIIVVLRPGRYGPDVAAELLERVLSDPDITLVPGTMVVARPGKIRITTVLK